MEIGFFVGASILLVTLIYATLKPRDRNRRKDKLTDQILRDRSSHDET